LQSIEIVVVDGRRLRHDLVVTHRGEEPRLDDPLRPFVAQLVAVLPEVRHQLTQEPARRCHGRAMSWLVPGVGGLRARGCGPPGRDRQVRFRVAHTRPPRKLYDGGTPGRFAALVSTACRRWIRRRYSSSRPSPRLGTTLDGTREGPHEAERIPRFRMRTSGGCRSPRGEETRGARCESGIHLPGPSCRYAERCL